MNEKAIDIFKIDHGKLGIVNINTMIPTPANCLTEVLPTIINNNLYKVLIQDQTIYLNNHKKDLLNKVAQFRKLYDKDHLPQNIRDRCCNFILLEREYIKYNKFEN